MGHRAVHSDIDKVRPCLKDIVLETSVQLILPVILEDRIPIPVGIAHRGPVLVFMRTEVARVHKRVPSFEQLALDLSINPVRFHSPPSIMKGLGEYLPGFDALRDKLRRSWALNLGAIALRHEDCTLSCEAERSEFSFQGRTRRN